MAQVPLRLAILRALTARLTEVEYVDERTGETVKLSENDCFRGRIAFGESDPLPLVSVLEAPDQPEGNFAGGARGHGAEAVTRWNLLIQGFITDDFKNPTDPAHCLMAGVKQGLVNIRREARKDMKILGFSEITGLTFNGGTVRPPDETSAVAHFWLSVYLDFVEDLDQPYVEQ